MKRFLHFLILMSVLTFPIYMDAQVSVVLYGQPNPETPVVPEEPEEPIEPSKGGPRIPVAPVYCEIDFEANSLTGPAILDEVTVYEVWSEDGTVCLGICGNAESFVLTLKTYPSQSTYMLKLRGDTFALVGYLYLD